MCGCCGPSHGGHDHGTDHDDEHIHDDDQVEKTVKESDQRNTKGLKSKLNGVLKSFRLI
jgi:hypothetical protein